MRGGLGTALIPLRFPSLRDPESDRLLLNEEVENMAGNRRPHRIRAKMRDNEAVVKVLIRHPMESGRRRDEATGEQISRHFIRELHCEHNGETVLSVDWSWGVTRNPYLAFRIQEAHPGDRVRIHWTDNLGEQDAVETFVS